VRNLDIEDSRAPHIGSTPLELDVSVSSLIGPQAESIRIRGGTLTSLVIDVDNINDILIRGISVNRFRIASTSIVNQLNLDEITSRGLSSNFGITNCLFESARLTNIKLGDFDTVNLFDIDFSRMLISSDTFPEVERLNRIFRSSPEGPLMGINIFSQQYELFRELGISLKKNNSFQDAFRVRSAMFEALRQSPIPKRDGGNIILALNSISNKHGLSLWRPFAITILLALGWYILHMLAYDPDQTFTIGWESIESMKLARYEFICSLGAHFKYVFVFLNPGHKLSNLVEGENLAKLGWISYLISFLARVSIGYSIFQFVSAFRRYGKI